MTTKYYNFDHMKSGEFEELYNASIYSDVSANQERTQQGLQDACRAQGFLSSLNPCSPFMDMRKLVNHPYLLRFPVHPGTNTLRLDEELVTCSGKMLVLDAMLTKLKQQGHKFTMMLDIIEEYLLMRCYRYCRLDGSRSILNRMENIELFNTDPDVTVFLLSTRAGGLGINLTGADTVIIYDSDWLIVAVVLVLCAVCAVVLGNPLLLPGEDAPGDADLTSQLAPCPCSRCPWTCHQRLN
ncbi:UNVERIFIED_CONTAM: hypothetical protein B566_EDAN019151 [Ephemera danica]|nr:hypothetical protein B566_EDAN019151 [Ephemera danica]